MILKQLWTIIDKRSERPEFIVTILKKALFFTLFTKNSPILEFLKMF